MASYTPDQAKLEKIRFLQIMVCSFWLSILIIHADNSHFIWHSHASHQRIHLKILPESNLSIVEIIKIEFPQFHTRAMWEVCYFWKVWTRMPRDQVSDSQIFYRNLTEINSSASLDYQEAEIDEGNLLAWRSRHST